MEKSPNQNLLPMKGTVEAETRRKAKQAMATRAIVASLIQVGLNSEGDYVSQPVVEREIGGSETTE